MSSFIRQVLTPLPSWICTVSISNALRRRRCSFTILFFKRNGLTSLLTLSERKPLNCPSKKIYQITTVKNRNQSSSSVINIFPVSRWSSRNRSTIVNLVLGLMVPKWPLDSTKPSLLCVMCRLRKRTFKSSILVVCKQSHFWKESAVYQKTKELRMCSYPSMNKKGKLIFYDKFIKPLFWYFLSKA